MSVAAARLARLRLNPVGLDRWSAAACAGNDRIACGLVGAQAVAAAGRTVDTRWRWAHSVHMTHLGDGDPQRPVEHRAERARDTEYGAVRLVRSVQQGTPLAVTTVTFAAPRRGPGPAHQRTFALDYLPDPAALPLSVPSGPLDVRHIERAAAAGPVDQAAASRAWVRVTEELPDEILPHVAAIVMAASLLLAKPLASPPTGNWADPEAGPDLRAVALDLSVRVHRGFRADDWMLHEQESPSAADYRAFTTGRFISSAGRLVASVAQETVLLAPSVQQCQTSPS